VFREFKEFINRGNVIDLAVAVILGTAFGAIITSLVDDIIMPLIGILMGGVDFSTLSLQIGEATLAYGNFIQAVINFLVVAFALFIIIRGYNNFLRKQPAPPPPPKPSPEEKLLAEIRDLLKNNQT
jgi:large conductance mechanosensitive channel